MEENPCPVCGEPRFYQYLDSFFRKGVPHDWSVLLPGRGFPEKGSESTVSGRLPFFFLVATGERTHLFFYKTRKEAQNAREHFLRLLGRPA